MFQLHDTTSSPYNWLILPFCDVNNIFYFKRTFLILTAALKRKQALLKSNLPAIKAVLIR